MAITKAKSAYQVGSFGTPVRTDERGDELTSIWFCGETPDGKRCAHRTRKEAEACRNRFSSANDAQGWDDYRARRGYSGSHH